MCPDKVAGKQLWELSTSLVTILAVTVTTSLASAVSSTFAMHSSYLLHAAKYVKVIFYTRELLRLCHTVEDF